MTTIHDIPTPALLLDLDVLESNLRRMAERCAALGVNLRPHVKTHKCVEVALGQRALGSAGITVSTLHEARVFADAGFEDITWALPVPLSRVSEAAGLAERVRLGMVVDSRDAIAALEATRAPHLIWLKVDCGYHRAGVDPQSSLGLRLAGSIAESTSLRLLGILSHSGHAYGGRSTDEIRSIAEDERRIMAGFADRLRRQGIEVPEVSVGSTPSMSQVATLEGVTEVRPGNYALYDLGQVALGSCTPSECAVTVLASVISSQPGAAHSVVDAGALALSQDPGPQDGEPSMGVVYRDYAAGELEDELRLTTLSQEHGILSGALGVGSRVRLLPNHSCLTVACFDEYHVVRGEKLVDRWRIHRGR